MVLDAGRIVCFVVLASFLQTDLIALALQVEFDSPQALLNIKDGKLRSLVDQSNDKDSLYTMVTRAR